MELSPKLYKSLVRPKWFTNIYINNILKKVAHLNDKKILDFGCGIGTSSCIFTPNNYFGVDNDYRRIHYAKLLNPEYNFSVLQNHHIPSDDNSIDYILVIAVIHHIPTDVLPFYLQEFHRILKPNGKIILIEPCIFKKCYLSNLFMKILDRGKYIQNQENYFKLFSSNNYQVKEIKKYKQLCFYNKILFLATPLNSNLT